MFKLVPNYKLDEHFSDLDELTNYNGTITAIHRGDTYEIVHWSTTILEYNTKTRTIEHLAHWPISSTTSRLVGRIVRSLPREAVSFYLGQLSATAPHDSKRIAKMVY